MQVNGYNPYNTVSATGSVAPAPAVAPVRSKAAAPTASPYGQDQFLPTNHAYVSNNTISGVGKDIGIRLLGRQLALKSDYIEATFIDKTPHNPLDIENADFNLHIKAGEAHISDVDVTLTVEHLLRKSAAQKGKDSPVSDLRVAFDANNQIRVQGKVKALGMRMPFEVSGTVSARASGELQYDLGKAKVAGVNVSSLMNGLGLTVDKLLKLRDPSQGFYTEGNSLVFDLSRFMATTPEDPQIQARIRSVSTHLGNLSLLVGDTEEDVQRVLREREIKEPAYIKAQDGHAYVDGFFLKDGAVNLYDRTPGDGRLHINNQGELNIQLKKGMVGITEPRFTELLKDEIGEGGDFKNIKGQLKDGTSQLSGTMYGFIPVKLNLTFGSTTTGQLYFTPEKPKAFGIVPLPEKWVAGKVQKLVKNGTPYGETGIALGGMQNINLGHVKQVVHQNGYVVIETGQAPQ